MTEGAEKANPGRWARLRERRQDRRQRRAWRRERRKGSPSVDGAHILGQQAVHGQAVEGGAAQSSGGGTPAP